jgi:hypothetical protein
VAKIPCARLRNVFPTVALAAAIACGPIGGSGGSFDDVHDAGSASGTGGGSSGSGGSSSSGSPASTSSSGASSGASSSGAGTASSSSSGAGSSGSSSSGAADGGPVVVSGACTDMATVTGTVAQQFGAASITAGGSKSYYLQSNWWQTFANETEVYSGLSFTVHNPQGASVPQTNGAPMGFPSIFIGQYAGNATTGSNLPKLVSSLASVPTIYRTNNASIGTSNHNATYDVWFTQSGTPLSPSQSAPGAGGAYLMVWMFKPTDRQPRGSDNGHTNQAVTGVDGSWNVWVDTTDPPCVSYVSTTPLDGLGFDLNAFIKDAVSKGYGLTNSMYLSIVFGGFEIWGGADGLELSQFCATVH